MRQVTVARSFRSQKPVAMGPCFRRDDIFLSQPPTASVSKSFESAKIYSLKPAPKPPVTRANGDAVFSLNGPASLLPSSPADFRRSPQFIGRRSMSKRIALLSAAFGALALTATLVAPVSAQDK